jgi:hypothetical protein
MNRLDKLFKDKLSKHEEIPTPQAWDQIHGRLAAKRRKALVRRLAIAASILLFATVGYMAYQALDSMPIKNHQVVVKSTDDKRNIEEQSTSESEEVITEIENSAENSEGADIISDEFEKVMPEAKHTDKKIEEQKRVDLPEVKIEEKRIVAEVKTVNPVIEKNIIDVPKEITQEPKLSEPSKEVLIAESEAMDEVAEPKKIKEKKTYSQIKIIYKANADSELVSSADKTLINKGIDKLTKFSNERLLTTDRKTKLRNTKEDLLALNFGKLLNKSNKETENL